MTGQDNEMHIDTEAVADDYDSPWKTAVEQYFPEFMAFYFPDARIKIDWAKGCVFLDQELQSLTRDAELGRRLLDKLVQITLNQWLRRVDIHPYRGAGSAAGCVWRAHVRLQLQNL
ncbi:hypothetical protein RP726_02935 [Candidatus Methylospira mobilis]|uniref:hypothetical protein n=1 Tax=Candidatus Methylospira mobilis TaxID=1808979 RepID=UPI0028E6CE87|nr:hypothetical protein [Candidatus Methylospira mobilis]WNV05376.1 hypothetical protein RP726_02935 [Candidatus Methylospira mobilis]